MKSNYSMRIVSDVVKNMTQEIGAKVFVWIITTCISNIHIWLISFKNKNLYNI